MANFTPTSLSLPIKRPLAARRCFMSLCIFSPLVIFENALILYTMMTDHLAKQARLKENIEDAKHSIYSIVVFIIQCSYSIYNFTLLNISHANLFLALNALSSPLVLESWLLFSPSSSNSAWIFLANCLPNSTPHWSKLLMFQTAPSVNVMCS